MPEPPPFQPDLDLIGYIEKPVGWRPRPPKNRLLARLWHWVFGY